MYSFMCFFFFIRTLLCVYIGLCVAKALEAETKISGEVITPNRGGPCTNSNICHNHCPGCKFTQCVDGQCVCENCYTPPSDSGFKSHS